MSGKWTEVLTSLNILTPGVRAESVEFQGAGLTFPDTFSWGPVLPAKSLHELLTRRTQYSVRHHGLQLTSRDRMDLAKLVDELQSPARWERMVIWTDGSINSVLSWICIFRYCWKEWAGRLSVAAVPGTAAWTHAGQIHQEGFTSAHAESFRACWSAFTHDDPLALQSIVAEAHVPMLQGAVSRLLSEYPALSHGLSRTEEAILRWLAHTGPRTATEVVIQFSQLGSRISDVVLATLASGSHPLLETLEIPAASMPSGKRVFYEVSAMGSKVLNAEADQVSMNGVDRWIGGVHLIGQQVRWRYDEDRSELIPG